jgi:hypothetical protein
MALFGSQTGTDKINGHGYHRYYPLYVERFRAITEPWAMMEIGIRDSMSLKMWKKYFPSNVFVYGLDIGVSSQGDRFHVFKADQSKPDQLREVMTSIQSSSSPIHFILDDGSHIPEHQILTFDTFFSTLLTPGGVYIIEDIETSYWAHGTLFGYPTRYGYRHNRSFVEIFKALVDDVNNEFLHPRSREMQNELLDPILSHETRASIGSITFGQNCVIVVKKTIEEAQRYNDRQYRWKKHLG